MLTLCLAGSTARAQDTLTLQIEQPFSPFDEVRYEWKHIGSTPAVAFTRVHAGGYGTDSELELVSRDALARGFEALGVCEALPLSSGERGAEERSGPRATLRWTRGGVSETREFSGEDFIAALPCIELVRSTVFAHLSPDRYLVPFWDEGEFGTLRATASQSAKLWVNGRPTHLVTPVNALRLEPGQHEVTWRALTSDTTLTRTVTIQEGMTTSTHGQL